MSKKLFIISLAVVVAGGVFWVGRAAYRKQRNLVSLDVYNMPLADVIRKLESQTGETILTGSNLDTRVTLALKNVPLDAALDRLAQQAGANWSRWHAVHASARALDQLEGALRQRTDLGEAGWTNLVSLDFAGAPPDLRVGSAAENALPSDSAPGSGGEVVVTRRKPVMIRLNAGDIKNGDVEAAVREQLRAAGADDSVMAQAGAALRQHSVDVDVQATGTGSNVVVHGGGPPNRIRMITRTSDGRGRVTEEIWSPQNLVLEQRLHPKLGGQTYATADEATAREVAKKAGADLTTIYLLRKSPGGFSLGGRMLRRIETGDAPGTNHPPGEPPRLPDIESVVRRAEAENFLRLTPEQRVQRAREKQAAKATQP